MSRNVYDANIGIEVQGRELRRALRATGNDVRGDLKGIHAKSARLVEDQSRLEVPLLSGTLRDTIRSSGQQTKGVVRAGYASVPYAGPIHFGWAAHGIAPQPFIYEAMDERREEVIDAYENAVRDAARKHGLPVRRGF